MAATVETETTLPSEPAQPEASATSIPRPIWKLWEARGFLGGSLAILIAWLGQQRISPSGKLALGLVPPGVLTPEGRIWLPGEVETP